MSHKNPLSLTPLQLDQRQTQYSDFTEPSQLQVLYSRVLHVVQAEYRTCHSIFLHLSADSKDDITDLRDIIAHSTLPAFATDYTEQADHLPALKKQAV